MTSKVNELEHKTHPSGVGTQAIVEFENGFSASVITGSIFYSTTERPYEIAVIKDGRVTYDTPVTNEVCRYLTEEEANDILSQIEALPPTT